MSQIALPLSVADPDRALYGLQFHPEVVHTVQGSDILRNFCFKVCGCSDDWTMASFIEISIQELRAAVVDGKVILGLSGGVDSSVAGVLLQRAIGDQLICVFVNNGLLRAREADRVREIYADIFADNFVYIDASRQFLDKLFFIYYYYFPF